MRILTIAIVIFINNCLGQTDYSNLDNWAFNPSKTGSLIDGYNMDVAIIDKNLNVDSIITMPNNAMINTGVDVFYVHPTILSGVYFTPDTVPINSQNSFLINTTIIAQAGILSKYGRFFAPRYRQSTPPTYSPIAVESLRSNIIMQSYKDVRDAFIYYLDHYNNGNKIILAGHSQGSYLLGLLLRDVFDNNPVLLKKLVVASLGGMNYVYTPNESYTGGWWENIPLCSEIKQCGCIQNWTSFKEGQAFPSINPALPAFNQTLINNGLVYQTVDTLQDRFLQDSLIYDYQAKPLRYYITPDVAYSYSPTTQFIAFDSLYTIRFRRDAPTKLGLNIEFTPSQNDQRPNELLALESDPSFDRFGYHAKDYHIYIWALMQQIDEKLQCANLSVSNNPIPLRRNYAYPNPTKGIIHLQVDNPDEFIGKEFKVYNSLGQLVYSKISTDNSIHLKGLKEGFYFLKIDNLMFKIIMGS